VKQQLQQRLKELKQEQASGQKMLADLQRQQAELEQTLLRISGAIQVLEELLAQEEEGKGAASDSELAARG
jgi:hypothetical protein